MKLSPFLNNFAFQHFVFKQFVLQQSDSQQPSTAPFSRQAGFTLVELMIVVTIIGILSAIAIPAYQNYIRKSEVTVGISTASALTTNIDLFIQENGVFPSSDEMASLGATPTMSSLGTLSLAPDSQSPTQGVLTFEFNSSSSLAGKKVQWTKQASDWHCVQDALDTIKRCPKDTEGETQ